MPSCDRSSSPASLLLERLLPRSRRQDWARDFVRFQIDDLNGLFDGLQGECVSSDRVVRARARAEHVLLAASWNEEMYREQAWAFVQEGLDRPEDAFGPALLLGDVKALSSEVRRWLAGLPAAVERTIATIRSDQAGRRSGLPK
jgi:hypothetical protein